MWEKRAGGAKEDDRADCQCLGGVTSPSCSAAAAEPGRCVACGRGDSHGAGGRGSPGLRELSMQNSTEITSI